MTLDPVALRKLAEEALRDDETADNTGDCDREPQIAQALIELLELSDGTRRLLDYFADQVQLKVAGYGYAPAREWCDRVEAWYFGRVPPSSRKEAL